MKTYLMPGTAVAALESMVDRIEANPGRLVEQHEMEVAIDTSRVLANLPPGMSEDDFTGIVRLAMLTECATDTYAREITLRAKMFGADWLERFNENVWKPDELMHAEPFKQILMGVGWSEAELDRQMVEAQERQFEHTGGDSPLHVTTFGMVQEYLTDHWHGLIGNLLKHSAPEAARITNRIKQRETLHTVWYRTMTSMQVEAAPELLLSVSEEIANFRLPGNSVAPDLQPQAERWLPLMGADFHRLIKDLVRLIQQTVDSPRQLGQLALDMAVRKDSGFGRVRPVHVRMALQGIGGRGYGLVGEAILERFGLSYMFKTETDAGLTGAHRVAADVRRRLRHWLAMSLPVENIAVRA